MKLIAALATSAVLLAATPAFAHAPGSWLTSARLTAPTVAQVTSGFGPRLQQDLKKLVAHRGIDYATPIGAPVHAAAGGEVVYAGWYGGYGKAVIVDHGNGLTTLVAHLGAFEVKTGQQVKPGQRVGTAGATGMTGRPVTHFEVRQHGQAVDPAPFLTAK